MVTMTDNDGRRISDMTYEEKKQKLQEQMLVYAQGDMLVAFSGGVDSSLILKLAVQAATKTGHKVYGAYNAPSDGRSRGCEGNSRADWSRIPGA